MKHQAATSGARKDLISMRSGAGNETLDDDGGRQNRPVPIANHSNASNRLGSDVNVRIGQRWFGRIRQRQSAAASGLALTREPFEDLKACSAPDKER
jgi:hypothetical protein